jgi:integrase/recombinase XerD
MSNSTISLAEKPVHFVTPNTKTKDKLASQILLMVRKQNIDYEGLRYIFRRVRKNAGISRPKDRSLPKLLTEVELQAFFRTIQSCGVLEHEIMLRLLFFTAVRVAELVNIKVCDVDLGNSKIFIQDGKGGKDRYVLFPSSFRLALESHIQTNAQRKYLFQSRLYKQYTTRRIQQLVENYGAQAGIEVHCHLFRHQMLTYLTRKGLSDSQIQLVSGHSSKKSLEIYQHLSLEAVEQAYQDAVRGVVI